MSNDQLEKLFNLEQKQDLLEVENSRIKECLEERDENNKVLGQNIDIMQSRIVELHEENENLIQTIARKEIDIDSLQKEIIEINAEYKNNMNIEKDKKECENQLMIKEAELKEIKEEMKQLEDCYNKSIKDNHHQKMKHNSEISSFTNEYERQKRKLVDQIRSLEDELERKHEETQNIIMDKIQLENKISEFDQEQYEAKIIQLKSDLKKNKILFKDLQKQFVLGNDSFKNRKLIKQMKNQIEELENERNIAIKLKKSAEDEIIDLHDQIKEVTNAKTAIDERFVETTRENLCLAALVQDNEDEIEEIMRKFKASVFALTSQQVTLDTQSETIESYEEEKIKLLAEIESLHQRLDLEVQPMNSNKQKHFENKIKELERKLELEETTCQRQETIIERLKQYLDKLENENEKIIKTLKSKEEIQQNFDSQLKNMREDYISLQVKEMAISEKKGILERQLEISESETMHVKSQLTLANQRIEDLHSILNSDTDSDCSVYSFTDEAEDDLDIFLQNHRKKMAEQKEEEIRIRKSIYVEQTESEC